MKPDWQDATDASALPPIARRVEFRDVSFSYQPGRTVLSELNFVAEPGTAVA